MEILRTPDDRFTDLPGYPFAPNYVEIRHSDGTPLRVHYLDEGPDDGPIALLMHGEPSWSYLYRKMIPVLTGAGVRCIAPDLVGFGRSDKPTERGDYTYANHVEWMRAALFDALDLRDVTLVGQDWGGLIGLRLVGEHPERFARVVAANTFLPTGDRPPSEAFLNWQRFSQTVEDFAVGLHRQHGVRLRPPSRGRRRVRRAVPRRPSQGGRPAVPDARADEPGRPRGAGEPRGVGRAAPVRQAVPHRVLRPGSRSPRAATPCSAARYRAVPGSRTRRSRARATSCRRTRARSWPGSSPTS
ncbi:MAG: hypothetical protein KatS3mg010_1547 [Acidimicrobiia bacterium]|nr:MAG: hypothetical protein KatS3mg010_1547 [Acidimicrobiia bacterium]